MQKSNTVNIGSNTVINDGDTVQVDHNVTTFVVSVRSMTNVGIETIKNLIQQKFEVVEINIADKKYMVKKL